MLAMVGDVNSGAAVAGNTRTQEGRMDGRRERSLTVAALTEGAVSADPSSIQQHGVSHCGPFTAPSAQGIATLRPGTPPA